MHRFRQSPQLRFTSIPTRLSGLAALLASIMIAGGCATTKVEPTAMVEPVAVVEPTDEPETAAEVEKTERIAMETRAGGVDVPFANLPPAGEPETTTSTDESKLTDVITDIDARYEWVGRKFANLVDATDKAFGESRVEDREKIARAKIGFRAKAFENEKTDWSVPSNFRIPLPALQRKANIYIDLATISDASNLSDVSAVTDDSGSSLSAAFINKLTDTIEIAATFDVYGGWDIGPKLRLRYNRRWDPWGLFMEQQAFVRSDDGWGGRTVINFDYELPDKASFIRFANRADYYEELHNSDLKSGLVYRRRFYRNTALSAEIGVEYNAYAGDPETKHADNLDDDHAYVRTRVIGKIWRHWIEWELMPGYYYKWEQDDPWRWGIEVRLSLMYESYLRSPD